MGGKEPHSQPIWKKRLFYIKMSCASLKSAFFTYFGRKNKTVQQDFALFGCHRILCEIFRQILIFFPVFWGVRKILRVSLLCDNFGKKWNYLSNVLSRAKASSFTWTSQQKINFSPNFWKLSSWIINTFQGDISTKICQLLDDWSLILF
jgi:hypothetical protein